MRVSTVILIMAIQLMLAAASPAQAAGERARIGLCLAGGGARGGAHIGVLQVLEELRVPVDYIAGTSIGSIVGGLYAVGMTPSEMDTTVAAIDWVDLFNDAPPRRLRNFRRKEEDRLPYFSFEIGMGNNGLKMPAGFVAGPKLLFMLRELTLPVVGIDDFDELPIPFRAVATDLEDGEPFVIGHGAVADAMRASMAIPGAFTPHVIDGRTLIDGGFVRNVPYEVVKAMGADIVIIVDISQYPTEFEGDPSLAGILEQTVTLTLAANARESVARATDDDLLLVPDLEGFTVEGFDRMGETVARGRAVAESQRDWLGQLSLTEAEYEAWRASVGSKRRDDEIIVGDVRVESPGRVDPRRVRPKVHSQPDAPLDLDILGEDISRVFRLGEFEFVDYTLEPRNDSPKKDLVVEATDKSWGPNYLRFGLGLEGHASGQTLFEFLVYHRMAAINRLGAEWRNQVSLGTPLGLDTEFYQPLTMNGRFFVAPRLTGGIEERRRYVSDDVTDLIKAKQYMGRVDLGLNMSHWGELRLGAFHGYYSGENENDIAELREHRGGWHGRLVFDQLDDINFPRHGWGSQIDGVLSREGLGADTEYDMLRVRVNGAVTTGRTTFLGRLAGGTSFGTELPFYDRFELGGFTRLSGLNPGQLFGDEMAMASLGVQFRVATLNPAAGGNVYLGVLGETGQTWQASEKPMFSDLLVGFAGYAGVETLLGPFYVSYGYTEGGFNTLSIYLGRTF